MATDVLDENHFKSQCSLYEPTHVRSTKEPKRRPTTTASVLGSPTMSTTANDRRVKYSTHSNISSSHSTTNSIHNRHSGSTDILSIIRSFAMKPFKTSSMTNAVAGGETTNVIGGSNTHSKPPVNLLRYRPLSDVVTDHASYTQSSSIHAVEDFLKRMGWPVNSTTDEARVKWNTAMKFLIPAKFDVNRAVDLYTTHQNIRKTENLDHIWINNPHLIREIQSSKFFTLPQLVNQPLTVIFTASNLNNLIATGSLPQYDRELITLQALVCQLDAATESIEVQQNGLNFIYDMQNCSASQFDMNLSKKILKLLQGGYPAMLKNIFIISAPKWFRVVYKVTLYSADQMRDYLTTQYGYSLDNIPISLGGSFDPVLSSDSRHQQCLSKVTNSQSICYSYYSPNYQPLTTKSTSNILFYNNDHHNQDKTVASTTVSTTPSLVAIVALRRHHESSSQRRVQKRESSSSSDNDKRQRSNESLIEEESPINNASSYLRKETSDDPIKLNGKSYRSYTGRQERYSMIENGNRDTKRKTITNLHKPLNETEFLSKSNLEIKLEFHQIPNPPAKDAHAAKEEKNLDKSRYRDVIPGELTRVKLQPDSDEKHDFINANYVSGYNNQEKAYIFTQGPLQSTVKDFWRMIWQENISVIVMTTNIRESGTIKCYPYWPLETKDYLNTGLYRIDNEKHEKYDSFIITTLSLKKKNSSDVRTIYHAHYLKWPDHGVPVGTKDALSFLEKVDHYRQLTSTRSPILLHCSAGIGRTGTFCAIDIGIKRYLDTKIIDIPSTVIKMRNERAGSVQTEDQYLFTYLALMDFIKEQQAIEERKKNSEITNSKKSLEVDSTTASPLINSSKTIESLPPRPKTLSESSIATVQHLTSSTSALQNQSGRQRSSAEHVSSMPSTNTNGYNRKNRK